MISSRMHTTHSLTISRSIYHTFPPCHTQPPAPAMYAPCHAFPPAIHTPPVMYTPCHSHPATHTPATHAPCHAHPPATYTLCHADPLPCTLPTMHTPLPRMPPAMHAPLPHMPRHHVHHPAMHVTLWTEFLTHASEKITLLQLRCER